MNKTISIQRSLRQLVTTIGLLLAVILEAALLMLLSSNSHYSRLLHNVTTASEFNQEFKNTIDQRMYYYVIESQYSQGLPVSEVRAAQDLARSLIDTTTNKDSSRAIRSVLDLCENLEQRIYQIQNASGYDDRQTQLENNIYVLTSLVEEYMYEYLYYEATELNALRQESGRQIITQIILISLVTAVAMAYLLRYSIRLSRSITDPLVALSRRAEEVSAGDLTLRQPIHSPIREVQTLSTGMENMLSRLNAQMLEDQQRQESLRRAELALLQAQINPHFLYNTMDTIIWLIEAEKTQEAVEMVSNLSSFFRHCLSKGRDLITLAEEEQHVRSYLQIQQARYKDIMAYTLEVDPAIGGAVLPKLTLQPLVENALYHGIKLRRGLGHIRISGRKEGSLVILEVQDNGVGMSRQRLEQLRAAIVSGETVGFGLTAVNRRLQLQFGREYGLAITSQEGAGTTVTARIPYIEEVQP